MNFKPAGSGQFNRDVLKFIKAKGIKHIIGIDRGERHLLYLTMIDLKGRIVEQFSLNSVASNPNNPDFKQDYNTLLAIKEGDRLNARRNWSTIENIKELKQGYLSQIVHLLSKMMIENDAILVLENLNSGFMRGRQKVEKSVYLKFEKMLIDKLNKTEATNRAKIRQYEKELGTLRTIMKGYIVQIDSLNTLNKRLTADAAAARREAAESRRVSEELTQQVENLSSQVNAGKVLKGRAISLHGHYNNNKVGDRHSRVRYMTANVTLVENSLADHGPVRVYVRVKDPEGTLLLNNESVDFSVNGISMQATASREVDYEGNEVDLSIFINDTGEFVKGVYTLEVYTDKSLLGRAECMLR
jgi:hypothetical protein